MHMSWFEDDFYSKKHSKHGRSSSEKLDQSVNTNAGKQMIQILSPLAYLVGLLIIFLFLAAWFNEEGQQQSVNAKDLNEKSIKIQQSDEIMSNSVVSAIELITPSVVSVLSYSGEGRTSQGGYGIGSGVIFENERNKLKIVTNSHVVEGGTTFEVVTYLGETYKARLVGNDSMTDLAVLEIETENIKSFSMFGDSESLEMGETVIALGNPLGLGFSPTVTKGIISSLDRAIPMSLSRNGEYDWEMNVIQTDAAINQGNSGGPLVNLQGEVIGINSSKISNTGVEGLGFAIPINDVKPVVEHLIAFGKVKRAMMGIISVDLQSMNNQLDLLRLPKDVTSGVVIIEATGESLKAGLRARDVIVRLDDEEILSLLELRKYVFNQKSIGDELEVTYYRDGKKKTLVMKLGERQ